MAEIAIPVSGDKAHPGTDRRHGFIRAWSVTDAARYDGRELPRLLDRTHAASGVRAGERVNATGSREPANACRSTKNEKRIAAAGLVSRIHFRKPPGKMLAPQRRSAKAARSRERAGIGHGFAGPKSRTELFIRTIGMARAKARIGLATIACNMRRLVFWKTASPA